MNDSTAESLQEALELSPRMLPSLAGKEIREPLPAEALLLHLCCGPCGEFPLQQLRAEGWQVTAYFFNPNIHPEQERLKRAWGVLRLAELKQLEVRYDAENQEAVWRAFASNQQADHCRYCYGIRMEQAAREAKAGGFAAFTTSLLVSPYQDREALVAAGEAAGIRHGVRFMAYDFRDGYRAGQEMARADGLYRQKYCGCIYSLGETSPKFLKQYLEEFNMEPNAIPSRERR